MRCLKRIIDLALLGYLLMLALISLPGLLGFRSYTVVSGSMEPAISAGSAVYVRPEAFENIQEGSIITFLLGEKRTSVTHRVVAKNEAAQSFVTKGDANERADGGEIPYADVIGTVRFCVPRLGYALMLTGSAAEKILLVGILLWLLLVQGILSSILELRKKEVKMI